MSKLETIVPCDIVTEKIDCIRNLYSSPGKSLILLPLGTFCSMSLFLRMSIPRYTQLLASLINPTNNIFYKIQWVCYKNCVGWVKKRCQLLGIPRYTHAEKQTQGIFIGESVTFSPSNVIGPIQTHTN
jgi:hypothetical protein